MQSSRGSRRRRRAVQLDVLILATAGALLVTTLLPQIDPDLNIVMKDRTLDVAMSALTLVAVTGLAALTFLRYRETGRLASFVQSSAYALWTTFTLVTLLFLIFRIDARVGMSLGKPDQLPMWVSGFVRVSGAGLFMISGIAALLGVYGGARRRFRMVFLPVIAIVALTIVVYVFRDYLPPLILPDGMTALVAEPGKYALLPGVTVLALIIVVVTVTALIASVVLYRMTWARGGPASDAFTALGLVILAVAEVQYALWPSVYSSLVTISDIVRLVAYTVLLAGAFADQRSDLRALRSAYTALDRLRLNEAERATLEERARLAREIHDGLAQHLWFAKLKFERLSATLSTEERPLALEVSEALDAAIVEAREALVTMRSSLEEDVPLIDMLERTIDDFEARSGLRTEFQTVTRLPASLAPRVQVELLRIISEALNNVSKHADATMVRVTAGIRDGELQIRVVDNGRGFAQAEALDKGLGLQGMRERARLIGGSLLIASELAGGTTVEVLVPLVNAGVGSVSETSERTAMVVDGEPDDLPELLAELAPGGSATDPARRGQGTNVPGVKPTGMQP
jgi:signal transduction histidine kinase